MTARPSEHLILEKSVSGERISTAEALQLLEWDDLVSLGRAANEVSRRMHPESYRTYNIDRNINYSNVCAAVCDFCAFYRDVKHKEAYVLEIEVVLEKIKETVEAGGDQILLQGGLHPQLPFSWYENLLRTIKNAYPQVNIHGFSPPEIYHFSKMFKMTVPEVFTRLREAGLGSLPGGGGEILVDRVRAEMTKGKVMSDDWIDVSRQWHLLGGRSSATMMFGHIETLAERISHLERIRSLQDETGGFTAFIGWTFQPENTEMSHIPIVGSFEYLKTTAVSRLFLDNIPNMQSSWVTQGKKIGQMALVYGCNDMGSLMLEENVVAEAGTVHFLTLEEIRDAISELGYTPRQRNVYYDLIDNDAELKSLSINSESDDPSLLPIIN